MKTLLQSSELERKRFEKEVTSMREEVKEMSQEGKYKRVLNKNILIKRF